MLQLIQGERRQRLLAPELLVPARHSGSEVEVAVALSRAAAKQARVHQARDVGRANGVEVDGPGERMPCRRNALAQLWCRWHDSAYRARGCVRLRLRLRRCVVHSVRQRGARPVLPIGATPQQTPCAVESDRGQPGLNAAEHIGPNALALGRLPRPLLLASRHPVAAILTLQNEGEYGYMRGEWLEAGMEGKQTRGKMGADGCVEYMIHYRRYEKR